MSRRIEIEDRTGEIDLSPMIDCIFILLIFFIVTTVFVEEQGIQVAKPDAAAPTSLEDRQTLLFEITEDDEVVFEGKAIGTSEVMGLVKTALSVGDGETPIVIRAHEKADHGVFVAVWDVAKRGGADMLSFSTVN